MPDPIVQLTDIRKRYPGADADVLAGLDLSVHHGDATAIVGPSGCGKSTLLNIIGALDPPTSGSVMINGNDLYRLDDTQLAEVRNRTFGFVFQEHHLLPQCSAIENVLIPTLAGKSRDPQAPARAESLLKRVGLGDRLHHNPGELSGGQRQRVAIVRALINRPSLLLIDEPTGSLDADTAEGIIDLLIGLNRDDGVALLLVTHALHHASRMQNTLHLTHGRLTEDENE